MKLKDLTPNKRNPRKITDGQLDRLKKSLAEFGDLSGFVYNKRSGNLVSGHQRQKVMPPEANVVLLEEGYGYVEIDGNRFSYREVEWDDAKEMAANISANQQGGEFDIPMLTEWVKELDGNVDLDLLGFSEAELALLNAPPEEFEPSFKDPSSDLKEEDFKLVVTFLNADDKQALFLELRDRGFMVKSG